MEGAETPVAEVRLSSGGCFPYGFRKELTALFHLGWPTSLSILFHQLIQPISLAFCGHLGNDELASVSLALSVIYMVCVSIARGLGFGGDTFFSQTYGSTNKKRVGVYLQKTLIFGILISFPICAAMLNVETFLLLIRINPTVARLTQDYMMMFLPGVPAYCWLFTVMRYLLCQNKVFPNLIVCIISCGINALMHYGLLYQAGMGIRGSAIALMMTYYLTLILLSAYIWGSGIYRETWAGWSWECIHEWGAFANVVCSSMFMTFIFWFCTEVGTFLAGAKGERGISSFSIMFQVEGFAWMVPLGLGSACTARIGQYLGANEPLGAITSCRVTLIVQVFISVTLGGLTYGLKWYIPQIFTSDKDLIEYTASMMPILAVFLLLEGTGGVGVGIVRGTGRQTLGAIVMVISYYILALPVGVPLLYLTSMGLAGLWWGFVLGLASENVCLMGFVFFLDWNNEAAKAQMRAGVAYDDLQQSVTADSDSGGDQTQPDADERTGLLSGAHGANNRTIQSDGYQSLGGAAGTSFAVIVVRRVCTLLVLVCVLVAGVITNKYVHITPPSSNWTSLCIPLNSSIPGDLPWNDTLPLCSNTTQTHHYPLYRIWV